ncbi:GspH/FimT family pseudopilin [Pseudomonas sp. BN606]|uniref:GspH/FimT family pseudopilin n=1 Tax=unclassified Pseudomonas TaxID=196821 RepID=UPI0015B718F5|nr:GspH/FimT family pseudopilin [Pseudomonas sp. BN606]
MSTVKSESSAHCLSSGPVQRVLCEARAEKGFTLVELMLALVVLAILIGIAVPSYQNIIASQRLRAAVSDLHSALVFARSEAIKRNRSITLSPSEDDWGAGWRIPSPVTGQDDILVRGKISGVSIDSSQDEVEFSASGRVTNAVEFEITVSVNADEDKTSCLKLGLDGRASSTSGEC